MSRLIVGPFNRVEGDLEVQLELDAAGARVREARVVSPMYRGFENLLLGRDPMDALVIVPRICGICSVSQSVAAALALADAAGVTPPANGRHALNLMLACENAADHLSHFYLFFLPDFTRPVYADRPWHAEALRRFAAQAGERGRAALAARQRWFTLMGTLGGKWPHTQAVEPGGSTRAIDAAERVRLLAKVREFRSFLERHLFAAPLEAVATLDSEAALWQWHAQASQGGNGGNGGYGGAGASGGDLRFFLTLVRDLGLDALGPGPGRYLSYGAYPQPGGGWALPGGRDLEFSAHVRFRGDRDAAAVGGRCPHERDALFPGRRGQRTGGAACSGAAGDHAISPAQAAGGGRRVPALCRGAVRDGAALDRIGPGRRSPAASAPA